MTSTALILVLLTSFAWVGFDVLRKLLVERIPPVTLIFLITVGQVPLFGAWALIDGWSLPPGAYWPPALIAGAMTVVASVAFVQALHIAPLSVIVPLLSLTPVFTLISAIPLLGEVPTPRQVVGVLLVVFGAWWLQRDASAAESDAEQRRRGRQGFWLMVLVAVFWSVGPVLDKVAMRHASAPVHAFWLCSAVSLGLLVLLLGRGNLAEMRKLRDVPGLFGLSLLTSAAALAFQMLAIQVVLVSVVETVKRGVGNVAALVIGARFFGESVSVAKVLAGLLMGLGVALIVL
ncbi:MAG: DMT family transporter [Acidobacteriota bacterium]